MAGNNTTANINNQVTAVSAVPKTIWMKQAEEAKLKSEAEKAAAAKAAFEATFNSKSQPQLPQSPSAAPSSSSDSDDDNESSDKDCSVGPVDPSRCTAQGAGIAGGTACVGATFAVVTKDAEGRKVARGGAQVKVRVSPGVGVGGNEQDGIVKDMEDGSYSVTYVVPKRGNYMVNVECNGKPIMGSPFPVFFSQGTPNGGLLGVAPAASYPNLVNQTMPNMPNYSGSVSGAFPGLLGMIPGVVSGASGGVVLPGMGSSLGEMCREYLNGRCASTSCKFNHPPHNLLMTALAATTTMGTLSQVPMAPSAAAMAAAQAIVAAQALQAHAAAQAQSNKDSSGSDDSEKKADSLKKTVQVSNLSPLLTVDQLKQLFGFCGTVVDCTITESKHFAYIEYSKAEEASSALALNNMDVGGRPLNVEMAKSLPPKPVLNSAMGSSSLPMVMQQAVAMQQMQFQQALLMQQTLTAQQAANRAATMKSATELAAARAAEISKKLQADGLVIEVKEPERKSRSPNARAKSKSRSRSKSTSPINYRSRGKSRSSSPPARRRRDYRSRSPVRSRHYSSYEKDHRSYKDGRDVSDRSRRRDWGRSWDNDSPLSRRKRSRSASPRARKSYRDDLGSPRHRRESPERTRKTTRPDSRSPHRHRRRSLSSGDETTKSKPRKRSLSRSDEVVLHSSDKKDNRREEKSKSRSRRRSRSGSADGRKHVRRSSPSVLEESRARHRRRSRSRSQEDKHQVNEKYERSKEDKSRDRDKRRSRSRSAEKRRRGSKTSPRHSSGHKSKHRKRSRSNSIENLVKNKDGQIDVPVESNVKALEDENDKSITPDDIHMNSLAE
ncbi:serine/threonine-protein kinase fray2-like [Salvia divinorum]|uniref:Serine/threonine-protein kinase fray2-like n=1 Tax=Salvia divinorum TaxID=28513 RepID=A0ABD1GVD7_SALDI